MGGVTYGSPAENTNDPSQTVALCHPLHVLFSNKRHRLDIGMPTPAKSDKANEIVVFSIVRESRCVECSAGLLRGDLLCMEDARPLCMTCADFDHLVFLPRGDAALTRRASKYSRLRAVVVRFSRARKRYERQGVLVEEDALERAETECLEDAEIRALRRQREAERRARDDQEHMIGFEKQIGRLYPQCPKAEQRAIARHACARSSGRVGRSAAAKQLDGGAVELAVRAYARHTHTRYDELLGSGWDRRAARAEVRPFVDDVLEVWRKERE